MNRLYKLSTALFSNVPGTIRKYPLYAISGISGSGKTTIGRILAAGLQMPDGTNCVFMDQDQFYIQDKPLVRLSTGQTVKNWDTLAALNPKMTTILSAMLDHAPVLLVGFVLTEEVLAALHPEVHLHLVTARNPQDLSARCKEARLRAKPGLDADLDALVVNEVVIPYYQATVRASEITDLVYVFDDATGQRRPIPELVAEMHTVIRNSAVRESVHYMNVSEPYHTLIGIGEKTVEGRKISATWSKVRKGDEIVMACGVSPTEVDAAPQGYGEGHVFSVVVTAVNLYLPCFGDPLGRYLTEETRAHTLPGVTTLEEGRAVYLQWSTPEEIAHLGMMALHVEVQ